jgi:hypothetical protein
MARASARGDTVGRSSVRERGGINAQSRTSAATRSSMRSESTSGMRARGNGMGSGDATVGRGGAAASGQGSVRQY